MRDLAWGMGEWFLCVGEMTGYRRLIYVFHMLVDWSSVCRHP